jgi:hypothetical protein
LPCGRGAAKIVPAFLQGIPMTLRLLSVSLAAAGLVIAATPRASALEPDAVAKALGAALVNGTNVAASYDSAHADGDNVVVDGLTVTRQSTDQTLRFDKVVVDKPTKGGVGVFQSPMISFAGGTLAGDSKGTIDAATVTDAVVLDASLLKGGMPGEGILFRTAEVKGIQVYRQAEPGSISIDRIELESGNVVDNLAQDSKGRVENVTLSPDLFPAGAITPASIGYDNLALDVSWDSSRDVSAKTITIRDFTVQVHDGGALTIKGVMGNLPDPRVLDDAGAASKASKTEVHQLTLRYLDNSLADRVLDALAKQQGLTREAYIQQLSAALPFLLLTLNNPAFQQEVTDAVQGFLKDPHSLTISLDPDAPVSGSDILSLLKTDPSTVPDRLKASVTANTPE